MAYYNNVILVGNLGKSPEIKVFQSGKKAASASLATSRKYKDSNGDVKEDTQWHTIRFIGKMAETIEKLNLQSGTSMLVTGEITYRSWVDQTTGQKRYATEIVANTFQLLGSKKDSNSTGYRQGVLQSGSVSYKTGGQVGVPTLPESGTPFNDGFNPDDELPF